METNYPDWSLMDYISLAYKVGSELIGIAAGGDAGFGFVLGILAAGFAILGIPLAILLFVIKNGFKVGTKTWVYLIVFSVLILIALLQ